VNKASTVLEDFNAALTRGDASETDRQPAIKRCNEHLSLSQAAHREFIRIAHTELLTSPVSAPTR
jgi:hypothetical protein